MNRNTCTLMIITLATVLVALVVGTNPALAVSITLTNTDAFGTTSFNLPGWWDNGSAPTSGNDYFVSGFTLRTPTSGSHTFLGDSLTLQSGGSILFKTTGTITINDLRLDNGNLNQGIADNTTAILNGNINLLSGGGNFNVSAVNRYLIVNSLISGSGKLTKNDVGTLTLNGANSYSGGSTINGGIVVANHNTAFGTGSLTINTGTTRLIVNGGINLGNAVYISGGAPGGGRGVIEGSGSGVSTISGPVTITASTSDGGHFAGGGGTLVLGGYINSAVTVSARAGNLIFSGGGNYSAISVGGLTQLGANNGLSTSASMTLGAFGGTAGTFDLAGYNQELAGLTQGSDTATVTNSSGTTSTLTLNIASGTDTYAGTLAGNLALTKNGSGALVLSAANSYTGATTLNGTGTLRLTNAGALGNTSGVTINPTGNAAVLELNGGLTISGVTLTMNSSAAGNQRSTLLASSGINTWAGTIVADGTGLVQPTTSGGATGLILSGDIIEGGGFTGTFFVRGGSGTGTITGNINLPTGTLNKTDGGTWVISSTGNTWGNTQVSVGTLRMGAASAVPATTVLTMGQGDANNATFDLNGFDQTVAGLALNTGGGTKQVTSTAGSPTFTVNNSGGYSYGGILAGSLALTKSGGGALTLSGANSYSGATTINGGVLQLGAANTLPSGTDVTVNSGGQFNLAGYANTISSLTVNGTGTAANSGGSATLTLTSTGTALTLQAGRTIPGGFNLALTGASGGDVVVSGPPGGGVTINSTLNLGSVDRTFDIADISGGSDLFFNGNITGSGGIIKTGTGTLKYDAAVKSYTGLTEIQQGVLFIQFLNNALGGPVTVNGGELNIADTTQNIGTLTLQSGLVSGTAGNSLTASDFIVEDGTITALLTGSAGLTKNTSGTVTLSPPSSNTYTGGTTVNDGILRIGINDALPTAGTLTLGGSTGIFDLNGLNQTIIALVGSSGGTITLGGGILTINQSANTSYTGAITGTGTLTKTDTGILTLSGLTAVGNLNIGVGDGVDGGTVVIGSGGTISIGSGATDRLSVAIGGASLNTLGTLDASASAEFIANVGTLEVGVGGAGGGGNTRGTLHLGVNNTITAASVVAFGDTANTGGNYATITTAAGGTTAIHTPALGVGREKAIGAFTLGAGATLTVDGIAGGRAALSVGRHDVNSGAPARGDMDLSAGVADLYLSSLRVGQKTGGGAATANGTLTLSSDPANHLDISGPGNVVVIGNFSGGTGSAEGTVTIGNLDATSAITSTDNSTAILLGAASGATGTLNLNGGTLTITTTGTAIGGGAGTSTLNLNGITLIAGASSTTWLQGIGTTTIQSGGVTIDSGANNITITQRLLDGGGGLTKNGSGLLRLNPSNSNLYSGGTVVNDGTLQLSYSNGTLNQGTIGGTLTINSGATVWGNVQKAIGFATAAQGNVTHVYINDGLLDFTGTGGLGGGQTVYMTGGTIQSNGGVSSPTAGGSYRFTASGADPTIYVLTSPNVATIAGRVALDTTGTFDVADGAGTTDLLVSAAMTDGIGAGSPSNGIVKSGAGQMTVTGNSTYTGATTILGGTLTIGATDSLPTTTALIMGDSTGNTGALDLSGFSQTIGSLNVASDSATANTITIGAGNTLTINGTGGLTVGVDLTATTTSKLTIAGSGSLLVENTSANVVVGLAGATDSNRNTGVLDLSGLSNVTLGSSTTAINQLRVGYGQRATGVLTLSDTANTITATTVQIAHSAGANAGGASTVILGAGSNAIAADTINIGVSKGNGTLKFASQTTGSPGTVTIGGKSTAVTDMNIGYKNGTATAATATGVLDLRGHTAYVTVDALTLGRDNAPSNSGGSSGTLYFDDGTFTVNSINMAAKSANGTGAATATLAISGGTFTVNSGGAFTLASHTGNGSASGTLTITGGTFISNVDILDGGNATTTITLDGGTLDMAGNNIGGTTAIDNLNFYSGTLLNVGQINNGATLLKSTFGTLTLGGVSTFTGNVDVDEGYVVITSSTALGSGTKTVYLNHGTLGDPELHLDGSAGDITLPSSISFQTSKQAGAGTVFNEAGDNTINGIFTLTAGGGATRFTVNAGTLTLAGNIAPSTGGRVLYLSGVADGLISGNILDGGGASTLTAVIKQSTGTWTLTGNNTYSGDTTVNGGTLMVSNTAGSGTGSGNVTVNTGATLGGTGTISGTVTINSGATLTPGSSVGTFTVGGLNLVSGSILAYEFKTGPAANDNIFVTTSGGLTINGGGFNLYDENTTTDFTGVGTYQLINYMGSIGGYGVGALSVLNPTAGNSYGFSLSGGWVVLNVGTSQIWNGGGGTFNWSVGSNWNSLSAPIAGDSLTFGTLGAAQVTNNNNLTANTQFAGISFTNDGAFTLNGNAVNLTGNVVNNTSNTQTINLNLVLDGSSRTFNAASGDLTVNSTISEASGSWGLVKAGTGTLTLTGNNSFTGNSTVSAGVLIVTHNNALGTAGTVTLADASSGSNEIKLLIGHLNGTIARPIDVASNGTGTITIGAATTINTGNANANFTGDITLNSRDLTIIGPPNPPSGTFRTTVVSGDITGTGDLHLAAYTGSSGRTFIQLTGNNTFSGDVLYDVNPNGVRTILQVGGASPLNGQDVNMLHATGNYEFRVGNGVTGVIGDLQGGSNCTMFNTSNGHGTISVSSGAYAGTIVNGSSGNGVTHIVKTSNGVLTLSGNNTYTGSTTVNDGRLIVASNTALGSISSGAVLNGLGGGTGTTIELADGITVTGEALTMNTAGGRAAILSSGTATWNGNITLTGSSRAQFYAETSSGNLTVLGNIAGTAGDLTVRGDDGTGTLSSAVSIGSTPFVKTGGGTWVVTSAGNTWGDTTVNVGTLIMGADNVFPAASLLSIGESGALASFDMNGTDQTVSGLDRIGSSAANKFVSNSSASPSVLTINNSSDYTYDGVISGDIAIIKNGTGTETLSGNNSFTGGATVNRGILRGTDDNAFGTTGTVTVNYSTAVSGGDGVRLDIQGGITIPTGVTLSLDSDSSNHRTALVNNGGNNIWSGPIVLNGSGLDQARIGSGTLVLSGDITGNSFTGTFFIRGGSTGTISGSMDLGAGTLSKTDDGTWVVGAPGKTYNWGNTSVARGTMRMGDANVLPATTSLNIGQNDNANATLDLNGFDQTVAALTYNLGSGGTKRIANLGSNAATLTVNNAVNSTFAGLITDGANPLHLVKSSGGDLVLTAANTYEGSTTINGGVIRLSGGNNRLPATTAVTLADAAGVALDMNNNDQTVTLLAGGGGSGGNVTMGSGNLTVNDAVSATYGGVISGTGSVTKNGASHWTLTGNNNYTGATAINAGTLELGSSADINGTSGLTINGATFAQNSSTPFVGPITFGASGGTLSGSGAIDTSGGNPGTYLNIGSNTVLSPGNSPSDQNYLGTMNWADGGKYVWEINDWHGVASNNWDFINLDGALNFAGLTTDFTIEVVGLTLANTPGDPPHFSRADSRTFPILNSPVLGIDAGFDPSLFTISAPGFPSASYVSWTLTSDGNTLWLSYTAMIPEPTVVGLMGLGSLLLLYGRRLRRRALRK